MTGSSSDADLHILAKRAEDDPAYMASAIRAFAQAEDRELKTVIASLGITENESSKFLLCLRPDGERFRAMLRTLCLRFSVDETALLNVLRQVEVLGAFASEGSSYQGVGVLLAARSRQRDGRSPTTKPTGDTNRSKLRESTESHGDSTDPEDDRGTS
jgi:hypothetical protein